MRQSELQEMRGLLDRRREDLMQVIVAAERRVREQLAPDAAGDSQLDYNHPADMVTGDPDYEKELSLVERQRAELTLVNQALHRLDAGEFGHCEACGADVAVERLRALPYARHCIECQARAERRLH